MIIVFALLLLLYLFIRYQTNKSVRKIQASKEAFWNKEYKSNETRKKDISSLPYIRIPLQSLPMDNTSNEELISIYEQINNLSLTKILNLTGISNTDLKLNYGVGNLTILSDADNSYTTLVSLINKWGSLLYDMGNILDAQTVLEYGVSIDTDISNNYTLLAIIYKEQNEKNKIDFLLEQVESLKTIRKDAILSSLHQIKER